MKQYAYEPNTVVIVPNSMGKKYHYIHSCGWLSQLADMRSIISLGKKTAILRQDIDLTWPDQKIADSIRAIDKNIGPITHFFVVSGHLLVRYFLPPKCRFARITIC